MAHDQLNVLAKSVLLSAVYMSGIHLWRHYGSNRFENALMKCVRLWDVDVTQAHWSGRKCDGNPSSKPAFLEKQKHES